MPQRWDNAGTSYDPGSGCVICVQCPEFVRNFYWSEPRPLHTAQTVHFLLANGSMWCATCCKLLLATCFVLAVCFLPLANFYLLLASYLFRFWPLATCYCSLWHTSSCGLLLAFCLLIVASCYLLLAPSHLKLATCFLLVVSCYLLNTTFNLLLASENLLLATYFLYLLLDSCFLLLATLYFFFAFSSDYLLLATSF